MTASTYGSALYGSSTYMTASGEVVLCWPVDTSLHEGYADRPAGQRLIAEMLAGETMRALTGYRMGGCPVDLRPSEVCGPLWCSCTAPSEVRLPVESGHVVEVRVDGVVLNPAAYRLEGGTRLLRVDGERWPAHQDLSLDPTEVGSFLVRYVPGLPVDALGMAAAGALAVEYAKALDGKPCALPRNATNVSRQGVSIELDPEAFAGGRTGIPIVDLYVQRWNPHHLKSPTLVWSPRRSGRADPRGLLMPLYGPRGEQGIPGLQGPPGAPGGAGSGSGMLFTQASPSASWSITHGFGRVPDVIVYDETGTVIYPDVSSTTTTTSIVFATPTAGVAVLN